MAYTPTEWKDHIVEHPNRYRVVDNGDGTVDILDEHGAVIQQGTPVDATRLNKIEQGIKDAHDAIASHLKDFAQVWNNRIVEMGSNANGTYVRWENGLQICWHHFSVVGTLNKESKASAVWTFPAQFINPPVVVANEGGSPAYASEITMGVVRSAEGSETSATIYARANVRNVDNAIWAYCVAFGRWK